jgi:hypothetical protein
MSDLRELLNRVREERGDLNNETLVAAATPKTHPLHDRLEWNDKIGGHKYRLIQASELIRSVKIKYSDTEPDAEVNAFASLRREDGGRSYVPIDEIAENPINRELLLRQARRDLASFERRYRHLSEYVELIESALASATQ